LQELWYTVGPSSLGKESKLLLNGATGARLTFSYGTPALQLERAIALKKAASEVERPCYVIADLEGENFRLGTFHEQPTFRVETGISVKFTLPETSYPSSTDLVLPVANPNFFSQLKKGNIITVGDGSAQIIITQAWSDYAMGEVIMGGVINNCRVLSIQGSTFQPRSITDKDISDLKHVLSSPEYDAVALSYVSSEADISLVRRRIQEAGRNISIIAKIETITGLNNINSICQSADFVMAARGDLALTIPWVELPDAVEHIAAAAKAFSTPWILATQIVEGLERFAIPTRAEICDLAHWLKEGCSGVLLSYETAFGPRPLDAISCTASMMARWGNSAKDKVQS
jgi:pyruvate kinase